MSNHPVQKDRRLGKGLAALLGTPLDDDPGFGGNASAPKPAANRDPHPPGAAAPSAQKETTAADQGTANHDAGQPTAVGATPDRGVMLSVYEIDNNPFQPRREFNESEIASLAESLKEHEQLQPIIVRRAGARYQLISGERRLRAAIHAGLPTVRADVREADDRLVAELAIIENLQRKDLNAIEKAMSFRRYIDQHQCTQDDLAARLKIDRSTIANLMRLLELPAPVIDQINAERISSSHARALLPLGDERQQIDLARRIEEEKWSVRATENHVAAVLAEEDALELGGAPVGQGSGNAGGKGKKVRTVSPLIQSLQSELKRQLGTKVDIRETSRGRGKITIHFNSPEEFERLQGMIVPGQRTAAA